jgi:hypothetical protein
MVGSAEFSGAVLGIRSRASTSAQRSAVALCTHAYRIDHLNIIPPLRRPGPPGLADFAIIIEYTLIQFSRYCVVPIKLTARYRYIIPEPHPVIIGRNRPLTVSYLGLVS